MTRLPDFPAFPGPAGGSTGPEFPPQPDRSHLRRLDMEWIVGDGEMSNVVVSSRIRVARNLKGHAFPTIAPPNELNTVLGEVIGAVVKEPWFADFHVWDIARLSPLELTMLVEKHLVSPLHLNMALHRAPGRALVMDPRGSLVAMVNEEDHLRLQAILPGLELEQCWERLGRMDDALESHLEYAFSDELGFLAACPSNLGTGMRASVMLHLPALALGNALESIKSQIVGQVGLAVRGMFGEGTGMQGNLLQISNQISLGPTEDDLIEKVRGIATRIVEQEASARQKLRRDFSPQLADRVWRALGILRYAQVMPAPEALEWLSMVRLGVDLEILPPISRTRLNELLVTICPATLQVLMGEVSDPVQGDIIRAQRIRQELAEDR